jgi:hypothetical protein
MLARKIFDGNCYRFMSYDGSLRSRRFETEFKKNDNLKNNTHRKSVTRYTLEAFNSQDNKAIIN